MSHDADTKDIFGFWLYILSDCILFSVLFACYAVLYKNTYGGISVRDFVELPYVFKETMALLISSFTYGLAIISLQKNKSNSVIFWLMVTFLFGLMFVNLEVKEFVHLFAAGYTWQNSAALSAFYTLVGTHGLHVSIGLIWMAVLMHQFLKFGATGFMKKRLTYLAIFWSFLDIIWIFVFTIVYLMGAI
jgi:cytochrome o ubiquinol oxidase subunit 3